MFAAMSAPPAADPPFESMEAERPPSEVYGIYRSEPGQQYDMIELLQCIVDRDTFHEYRGEYGRSIICADARIGGWPCGIVANQKKLTQRKMPGGKEGPSAAANMPGVIFHDSADKAAR